LWLVGQRDACVEVLMHAGSEGMTVTEVVTAIQRRELARLHGRTPHNSITRCLSADATFIRLQVRVLPAHHDVFFAHPGMEGVEAC
jgi:hypothetical protein